MTSSSRNRVPEHTAEPWNEAIRLRTAERIAFYERRPELIERRLAELDREWDVERCLETGSSALSLTGLLLALRRRRWLLLPLAVQSFFLQHALQGWCPPLPLLRRLGVRTESEIEEERRALLDLRRGAERRNGASHARASVSAAARRR
jgi:hypothetical protein